MFSNLIESSSHRGEFRRRGSFLLFTTASYSLLFVIAGVVSIFAYDACMEDRSLELVTMMPLVDLPTPDQPPAPISATQPHSNSTKPLNNQNYFQREIAMSAVDQPNLIPKGISTERNVHLPMPTGGIVRGGPDSDPGAGSAGPGSGGPAHSNPPVVVNIETPPPLPPAQVPVQRVVRKSILNGEATFLPKPPYPEMAKQMKIQGIVNVQVLVDETGRVVSRAVSGHAFLAREAQKAAFQARFSPTLLGDRPVKVSGMISYNFVLQ